MSTSRLLLTSLILGCVVAVPLTALAVTGENSRFDFSSGVPAITDDTTNTCNNQALVRFDFSSGQPTEVYDSTATCSSAAGSNPPSSGSQTIITNGTQVVIPPQGVQVVLP